ncbi:MAG: ankyrin repeat domain-containing protein [Vulcanimicrobiota bacterium]
MDRFIRMLTGIKLNPVNKEQKGIENRVTLPRNDSSAKGAMNQESTDSLHRIVTDKDSSDMDSCLSGESDINQKDFQGQTALHLAARVSCEIAGNLIKAGADIETITKEGRTPLMEAVLFKQKEIVKLLLKHGACLDKKDIKGFTAFDYAKNNHEYEIMALIEEERYLRKKQQEGVPREKLCTARDALSRNDLEAVQALLEEGLDIRDLIIDRYYPPPHWAARKGHFELMKLLLSVHRDINARDKNGSTILFNASACGQQMIVEFLLDQGADMDNRSDISCTPVYMVLSRLASEKDRRNEYHVILKMLAERGAELYTKDFSNLGSAAPYISPELMSLLRSRITVHDKGGENGIFPLHEAVRSASPDIVRHMLEKGCNVNLRDRYGKTALFYAPTGEIAGVLINSGATLTISDREGLTPLHDAKDAEIAAILINRGIDVNTASNEGLTPLHCAHSAGVAVYLIQRGASLEARDRYGRTPLFNMKADTAAALIDHGADLNAIDSYGETALHEAAICGNLEKAELLVNRGASINIISNRGETPYDKAQYQSDNEWKWRMRDRVGQFLESHGGKEGDARSH